MESGSGFRPQMDVVRYRDAKDMMQMMRRCLLKQKSGGARLHPGVFVQRSDRRNNRQFVECYRSTWQQPRSATLPDQQH